MDVAAGEPGLNAPCMTLDSSLCVNDVIIRVSEAHSWYESLPPKDLRPSITDAMSFVSPMAYINTIFGRCSMTSDSCDDEGSMSAGQLWTQNNPDAELDGPPLLQWGRLDVW